MPVMEQSSNKPTLDVLQRRTPKRVPFWLMRQAGRYLPEYRELRSYAGSFLDLVYDPDKASEVTLQPVRRYGMDAAILFSDILVVPHALGQSVTFEAGEGPKLQPLYSESDFAKLNFDRVDLHCKPVYDTVRQVREKLKKEKFDWVATIGFCGSPWTVICYMIEGGGSKDFEAARRWALRDPKSFQKLVDLVTAASIAYLAGQIKAGAEVIQLFESWAGILDGDEFRRWIIEPTKTITTYLKKNYPHVPVIGFPRTGSAMIVEYAKDTGIDAISLDYTIDPVWAAQNLQPILPVQGNLDPVRLLTGGEALESGMKRIFSALIDHPFIFNLGHGVIKETKPEHVAELADMVWAWGKTA